MWPTQMICQMMRLMVSSCRRTAEMYKSFGHRLQQALHPTAARQNAWCSFLLASCMSAARLLRAAQRSHSEAHCLDTLSIVHASQSMTQPLPVAQAFLRHLAHGIELALSQRLEPGSTPKQVSTLAWTAPS